MIADNRKGAGAMARGTPAKEGGGVGIVAKVKTSTKHLVKRLTDPHDVQAGYLVCTLLIIHEVLLSSLIIGHVGYTEIDWEVRRVSRDHDYYVIDLLGG